MMRNAAESLRPGGYFIGTIPNANDIVYVNFQLVFVFSSVLIVSTIQFFVRSKRQKKAGGPSFGNDVFKIELNCDVNEQFPLFGAKYDFFLEGVVNCPEFLVHFPLLIK